MTTDVIHAIQPVGDGTGEIDPATLTPESVTVQLSRRTDDNDQDGTGRIESVWMSNELLDEHMGVWVPDVSQSDAACDAVIVIAGAPVPPPFRETAPTEITIDIRPVRSVTGDAAACPRCGDDLRKTFHDGGCTVCGFYFDGTHLDPDRQAELDTLAENYDAS